MANTAGLGLYQNLPRPRHRNRPFLHLQRLAKLNHHGGMHRLGRRTLGSDIHCFCPFYIKRRHCEERSDEAIQSSLLNFKKVFARFFQKAASYCS
jgi:hypothetical protein